LVLSAFVIFCLQYLFGLDRLIPGGEKKKHVIPVPDLPAYENKGLERREVIRNLISVRLSELFAYALLQEKRSGIVLKKNYFKLRALMPTQGYFFKVQLFIYQKTRKVQVRREIIKYSGQKRTTGPDGNSALVMGGNLIGGWAHSTRPDLCL